MKKFKWYVIGASVFLAFFSVVMLFDAGGTSYKNSVWKPTIAHIDEAVPVCKYNGRSLHLPFDCVEATADPGNYPELWSHGLRRAGSRGRLSFTTDGKQLSFKFNDANVEANDLKVGMNVAIKYNGSDPSEFELASALQRRVGVTFWLSLILPIPGVLTLGYYLQMRRYVAKVQ